MKSRVTKSTLLVVIVVAGVISLATWLNPFAPVRRARSKTIETLRAANHERLLIACRALMADAHTYTNDREVMSWETGWQATVDRGSPQYQRQLPVEIRSLSPVCVRIATNQVYLFYWNSPVRLAVRAFAPGVEQFGTERLCDGLWIVTSAKD